MGGGGQRMTRGGEGVTISSNHRVHRHVVNCCGRDGPGVGKGGEGEVMGRGCRDGKE